MSFIFQNIEKYLKSTRFKTTLWYSLLFLLLEIVLGTIIYVYVKKTMTNELDLSLTNQANSIYKFIQESKVNLFEFEPDSIYSTPEELVYNIIFEALAFNPNNTFVQISIKDKIVFHTSNLGSIVLKTSEKRNKLDIYNYEEPALSKFPIRVAYLNKEDYKIIVAFPLELISKTLDNLIDIYIIIAPLFLVLSFLGGSFLSFKVLARIDKIIKRTAEIDTFNLDAFLDGEEFQDEYGRLVKTINGMLRRIKNSIEYMNQFTISASHELKTPLTILRGELELALKSPKSNEQYLEIIKSSHEETLRLINIVERLFFITKLDKAFIALNKEKVNLIRLVSSVVNDFKNFAEEKKINLILDYSDQSDFFIDADPEMMRQVFINLLDNAIKYSFEESEVIININRENNRNYFSIMNRSEPIPDELLPKLFDRFFRIESSRNRNFGGVGLGLSVVKQITDLHQFEIKILNIPVGTFKVVIYF